MQRLLVPAKKKRSKNKLDMRVLVRTSVLIASWVACRGASHEVASVPAAAAEEGAAAHSLEQLTSLLRKSDATIARLEARLSDLEQQVGWATK